MRKIWTLVRNFSGDGYALRYEPECELKRGLECAREVLLATCGRSETE